MASKALRIDLTLAEAELVEQIIFDVRRLEPDEVTVSARAASKLMLSLLERDEPNAVKHYKLVWGMVHAVSAADRLGVIATEVRAMLSGKPFIARLEELLYGPALPPSVQRGFRQIVEESGVDDPGLEPKLLWFVLEQMQIHELDRQPCEAPQAFYRLALECGVKDPLPDRIRAVSAGDSEPYDPSGPDAQGVH
jgi:hypothetical protein